VVSSWICAKDSETRRLYFGPVRTVPWSRLSPQFRAGAREGFRTFLPLSIGLVPWALVTGVAMRGIGLSPVEAMGMNLIVFAGAAQLGTLPLIAGGAPLWVIVATALALNLRFVIFSAGIARYLGAYRTSLRWLLGHLLTDGVFALAMEPMLRHDDRDWRLGFYLVPSAWGWLLWQLFALAGVLFAGLIPRAWSLEFMATIALMVILIPMVRARPMLLATLAGGGVAVALHALPLRLGLFVGILAGVAAGMLAEGRARPVAG
jgi:predicted branched-subunit amino acid permease